MPKRFTDLKILALYPEMKKKLIEVALPLEAINKESAREKSIRHGHPSTLHLWWARRPLAACRAVLFASMVDDPSEHPELFPTEEEQDQERERLFDIIRDMVKWENVNNEKVLERARREIRRYAPDGNPPPVLDPFAGGGSIPLEAQRLGLEAHAGDLNPVAVLINKALIEIPPRFAGQPPVHPEQDPNLFKKTWKGAQGLAEDVRYYGQWMRDEAEKRIGHLYPKVTVTAEMLAKRPDLKATGYKAGDELTVIAWLWARTVPSPNPAAHGAHVPLVRSFWLSKKKGKEAWVEPIVERDSMTYCFELRRGQGYPREGTVSRSGAICLLTGSPIPFEYIREQAKAGHMKARLMAIAVSGSQGRLYIAPSVEQESIASEAEPLWKPSTNLPDKALSFRVQLYGIEKHADLFTKRQVATLSVLSDSIDELIRKIADEAKAYGIEDPNRYATAVVTYICLGISKLTDYNCTLVTWSQSRDQAAHAFTRQSMPMVWDFAEVNPFAGAAGDLEITLSGIAKALRKLGTVSTAPANVLQTDATEYKAPQPVVYCTDPPYYDNIGYADLSDFFYVWLRRLLGSLYPGLFGTMLTPKSRELIATPYRHNGSRKEAQKFFEKGLGEAFQLMRDGAHPDFPVTVFYAFKQAESDGGSTASTGWETMLAGMIDAGFSITGTWPMRTERSVRSVSIGTNALASSIVLVCRPRPENAPRTTRGGFLKELRQELPEALRELQHGYIAPVDLAQASIGPGMAVFSRYREVLETDGSPMTVRTALALINQVLDEFLAEQEGEYDPDTRWALAWYEQHGFEEGKFGVAETLSKAKNTSVQGLDRAGILTTGGGTVRLLLRDELDTAWNPASDARLTVWEAAQHLIRALEQGGEIEAASLLVRLRARSAATADAARDLAYRLYALCERKQRAAEALAYNTLIVAWPQIEKLAHEELAATPVQGELEL